MLKYIKDPKRRDEFIHAYGRLVAAGGFTRDLVTLAVGLAAIVLEAIERAAPTSAQPASQPSSAMWIATILPWCLLVFSAGSLLGDYLGYLRFSPTALQAQWMNTGAVLDREHLRVNGHVNLDNSIYVSLVGDRALLRNDPYLQGKSMIGETLYWPAPPAPNEPIK
jgi:hypothetical protein